MITKDPFAFLIPTVVPDPTRVLKDDEYHAWMTSKGAEAHGYLVFWDAERTAKVATYELSKRPTHTLCYNDVRYVGVVIGDRAVGNFRGRTQDFFRGYKLKDLPTQVESRPAPITEYRAMRDPLFEGFKKYKFDLTDIIPSKEDKALADIAFDEETHGDEY